MNDTATQARMRRVNDARARIAEQDAERRAEALRRYETRLTWRDWLAVPVLLIRAGVRMVRREVQ